MMSNRWDVYFRGVCEAVASKSPCLSRQIGALLVRDKSIVSTGFNGPPRGVPHCGEDRYTEDNNLNLSAFSIEAISTTCPRKLLGYKSGTHMELCPAQHAEENAVITAARNGVTTLGCTLYMNSVIPCKNCFGTLINSGISEIVVDTVEVYDEYTKYLINNSQIIIRAFDL